MTAETRQRGSRRDEGEDAAPASGGSRDSPRRLIGWTIGVVGALALGVWLVVRLLDIVLLIYVRTRSSRWGSARSSDSWIAIAPGRSDVAGCPAGWSSSRCT